MPGALNTSGGRSPRLQLLQRGMLKSRTNVFRAESDGVRQPDVRQAGRCAEGVDGRSAHAEPSGNGSD